MTIRKYTITDRLLISADELTPRQADAFWLDLVELADQHGVTLHGVRLVEVDGPVAVEGESAANGQPRTAVDCA